MKAEPTKPVIQAAQPKRTAPRRTTTRARTARQNNPARVGSVPSQHARRAYRFDVITIFPEMFDSVIGTSILKRARAAKKIDVRCWNPRDVTTDTHHVVDDTPYGGGVGMVMKVDPIVRTLRKVKRVRRSRTFLLSARGRRFTQEEARRLAQQYDQLVFVCGRYEGVDERVLGSIDEELSIGDFVMTGGELGAMVVIDAVTRLLPGVLGKDESSHDESHSQPGYLEYPQYTRPAEFEGKKVPPVLLTGNHKKIAEWRKKHARRVK